MSEPRVFVETFTGIDMHSTVKGHDKHLHVLSFEYAVDIATRDGAAIGRCEHHPVIMTFVADVETAMLLDALARNSDIKEITVKFYRHQGVKWSAYSVITLKQARAVAMRLRYAADDGLPTYHVTATFVYGQIEVECVKKKFADQVFDPTTRK